MPLWKKAQTIVREIYGGEDVIGDQKVRDRFKELQDQGYGIFPSASPRRSTVFQPIPT